MRLLQVNHLSRLCAPITVNLEVTNKCNMGCTFCYNAAPSYELMHRGGNDEKLTVSGEIGKQRIFRLLDILAENNIFEIRLFGGEFTVYGPWREILKYAFAKGFFISFVSNGYLITIDDVILLAACGVRDCTISVHGIEKEHDCVTRKPGSFCRAMQTIELLQKQNITVNIAYTPNVENLGGLYQFVRLLSSRYSARNFSISRLFSDSRYAHLELKDYIYLLKQIDRCHCDFGVNISLADSFPRCRVPIKYWQYLSYCSQGVGFAQVDFKGELKHCSGTSCSLGNLFETNISDLWLRELEGMRNLKHLPRSCQICPIFCGGGCTVSRGVEHKFASDEFIPQAGEEGWLQTLTRTVLNYIRRFLYCLRRSQTETLPHSILDEYPKVCQRFKIRKEDDVTYVAMFEKRGVRILSEFAAYVLNFLDGKHTVQSICDMCREKFPHTSEAEVRNVISSLV